jgi:hypothetical protein
VRCNVDRTCLRIITIDEGSDVVACNFFNVKVHFWRFGDTLLALRRFLMFVRIGSTIVVTGA